MDPLKTLIHGTAKECGLSREFAHVQELEALAAKAKEVHEAARESFFEKMSKCNATVSVDAFVAALAPAPSETPPVMTAPVPATAHVEKRRVLDGVSSHEPPCAKRAKVEQELTIGNNEHVVALAPAPSETSPVAELNRMTNFQSREFWHFFFRYLTLTNPDKMAALNQAVTTTQIADAVRPDLKQQLALSIIMITGQKRFFDAFREFNDCATKAFKAFIRFHYPEAHSDVIKRCKVRKLHFLWQIEYECKLRLPHPHACKLSAIFWEQHTFRVSLRL
jgi:hypothetical protein